MTGPLGREIAAALGEVRDLSVTDLMPDTYEVKRMVATPDGYGGTTTRPETVETGPCKLSIGQRLGTEASRGGIVVAESSYTARLPLPTTLAETDTLEVNGRVFEVTAVLRGGAWATTVVAQLEARS